MLPQPGREIQRDTLTAGDVRNNYDFPLSQQIGGVRTGINCSIQNTPLPLNAKKTEYQYQSFHNPRALGAAASVTLSKNMTEYPNLWLLAWSCIPLNRSHPEAIDFRRETTRYEALYLFPQQVLCCWSSLRLKMHLSMAFSILQALEYCKTIRCWPRM